MQGIGFDWETLTLECVATEAQAERRGMDSQYVL